MRPKSLILLALALGCGLIASMGISEVINSRSSSAAVATEPVLVATVDIERSTLITAENVAVKDWPVNTIPEGALRDMAEIEGARAFTRIAKDIPLTHSMLGGSMGAAEAIPEGYRPFNVRLNQEGGSIGLIKQGNRVDVFVFAKEDPAFGIHKTGVWRLLSNVEVFAIDAKMSEEDLKDDIKSQMQTVSLLVTSDQFKLLTLADKAGELRLTLRGADDTDATALDQSDLPAVFGGKSVIEPVEEKEMPDIDALTKRIREEERKRYDAMLAEVRAKAEKPPEPKRQIEHVMEVLSGARLSMVEFAPGELPTPKLQHGSPELPAVVPPGAEPPATVIDPAIPAPETDVEDSLENEAKDDAEKESRVKELVEDKLKELFGAH